MPSAIAATFSSSRTFQLTKAYGDVVRVIAKPVAGAVRVAVHRDPRFLAESLRALADDADARAGLRQACRALGLDNGLDAMVEALAELAGLSRNPDRASP